MTNTRISEDARKQTNQASTTGGQSEPGPGDISKLLIVSNRLPITIGDTIRKSSGGLVAALETERDQHREMKWIGWPGTPVDGTARRKELDRQLRDEYGCLPVFLTESEVEAYYQGFCNSSVWPLLHYMPNYMRYDEAWWDAYESVNRMFATKVLENAGPNELVWIHDYHLMLLPAMVKAERPDLRIGFFLHTPFPSYEVFRCHPKRVELLEGLLGADQIGFHTFGYLRHFRSSVLRLLGLDSEINRISHAGQMTYIGVYPIGINAARFQKTMTSKAFHRKRETMRETYEGRQIVLSVERLDYTKGIVHRLKTIDTFLARYPEKDRVRFIFISVPSRGEVEQYQMLLAEIEGLVGQINGRHSTVGNTPVHFIFKAISFTELCALYSLADVALVTPLIDGMNLVAKEYVACQSEGAGALMLSEFAGAAEELFAAIQVNPYDVQGMAASLEQALQLSSPEKQQRMRQMRDRVLKYDARYWATSFMEDLNSREPTAGQPVEGDSAISRIIERARQGRRHAYFLDYDGTLREFEADPGAAAPTEPLRQLFHRLENTPDLDVYIVSGRQRGDLEAWLGAYNFTLVAEHGGWLRRARDTQWHSLNPTVDLSWKQHVLEVFRHYEGSTPGSWVEEKHSAVVWHYRRSDPEFGRWKASLLIGELYEMLSNLPVELHHGKAIVEVSSLHINKRIAVEHLLTGSIYDFVMCAGDDQTDESMFRVEYDRLVRIKVGQGDTRAEFRVPDPARLRQLLDQMIASKTGVQERV